MSFSLEKRDGGGAGGWATYVSSQPFDRIRSESHVEHLPHTRRVAHPRRVPQAHFIAPHVQQLPRHVPHVLVVHLAAVRARNHDADVPTHPDALVQGTVDNAREAL